MVGIVFALVAAICWGFAAIMVRLGVQSLRPTTGTWMSLVPGLLMVMSLAVVFNLDEITTLVGIAFAWFALSGLFNFALGRLLNTISVDLVGVTRSAPLFAAAPLFATIFAVVFLGESITPLLLLGTITVMGGIALITSERVSQ
jgi:drug/metabolite transporter (DMT)-like permease